MRLRTAHDPHRESERDRHDPRMRTSRRPMGKVWPGDAASPMTHPPRDAEIGDAQLVRMLAMCEVLKTQGWAKVLAEVTRGGTLKVQVEGSDGAKVVEYASIGGRRR